MQRVATSTSPRAVQLRVSYATIFRTGEFSDADLAVLATARDQQDLSGYGGHDVEFVPSHSASPVALAPRMTCLQAPTPGALNRPSDTNGHLKRGISRTLKARIFLNRLTLCGLSTPDYMRVISETGRASLALFYASYESSFRIPHDCYVMATHHVLGLPLCYASHDHKCPRCYDSPGDLRGYGSSSTTSSASISGERTPISMLIDHTPHCPWSSCVFRLHDRIVHVLEELMVRAGAIKGRDLILEARRI
jgi:hypothetical protein